MQVVEISPWHVRPDQVATLVRAIDRGGVVAFPTDTAWTLACDALQRGAVGRLEALRRAAREADASGSPMSLLCGELAQIGTYALLEQSQFRLLKRLLPGPYTVVLPASREVPRQLQSNRKTVGVRMPDHPIAQAILQSLGRPMLGASAHDRSGELCSSSAEIEQLFGRDIDVLVETEPIVAEPSTVLDCTQPEPVVLRVGRGEVEAGWRLPDEPGR